MKTQQEIEDKIRQLKSEYSRENRESHKKELSAMIVALLWVLEVLGVDYE